MLHKKIRDAVACTHDETNMTSVVTSLQRNALLITVFSVECRRMLSCCSFGSADENGGGERQVSSYTFFLSQIVVVDAYKKKREYKQRSFNRKCEYFPQHDTFF